MTNGSLQHSISSWFPIPEVEELADSKEQHEINEISEENIEPAIPINSSLLEFSQEASQFLNITVQPEQLYDLMRLLKTNDQTHFDYLFCLSGVDFGEELGVVYHLESTIHRHMLVVKVKTSDRENPMLDSVCDIWYTAEFHEREVFDFFGIKFKNHPNLKRLFLTEDWDGFPLRKDYEDTINMIVK